LFIIVIAHFCPTRQGLFQYAGRAAGPGLGCGQNWGFGGGSPFDNRKSMGFKISLKNRAMRLNRTGFLADFMVVFF